MIEVEDRVCNYRNCGKDISDKRPTAKYCNRGCKGNEYKYKKRKNKKVFSLSEKIRSSISIRKNGYSKKSKTTKILGCSFEEFKRHLEGQFEDWMSWDNYGLYNGELDYGWDIDHIKPISSAKTEEEVIKLNHYTNLQPLCSKVNREIKRDIEDF